MQITEIHITKMKGTNFVTTSTCLDEIRAILHERGISCDIEYKAIIPNKIHDSKVNVKL